VLKNLPNVSLKEEQVEVMKETAESWDGSPSVSKAASKVGKIQMKLLILKFFT